MTDRNPPLSILYQDSWLIVVDKPAGVPTQPTPDPARPHLQGMVEQVLREQGVREPYVALHHRLDRDTTGVVVMAIHRDANVGLGAAFAERLAEKEYVCLCDRDAGVARRRGERWQMDSHLRARSNGRGRVVEVVRSGGQRAQTDFVVGGAAGSVVWLVAHPLTGRTHQIRVHCAESGLPIVGDRMYGRRHGVFAGRVMLHARQLRLPHPVTGELLELLSPVPMDMQALWGSVGGSGRVGEPEADVGESPVGDDPSA